MREFRTSGSVGGPPGATVGRQERRVPYPDVQIQGSSHGSYPSRGRVH
jgi:hypothetical protein